MLRDLGTLGGTESYALAINASGHVVGGSYPAGDTSRRGFLWTGATMIPLGVPDAFSEAAAINASGQIVGFTSLGPATNERRAFLYANGALSLLPTLGGTDGRAYGINDQGQVTGYTSTTAADFPRHAFVYSNGALTDLGTLGGQNSVGLAINAHGDVTGSSDFAPLIFRQHAFVYSGGKMVDIGTQTVNESVGLGINASGLVVGFADGHAFVYVDGKMHDLNLLTSGIDGIVLASANAINDSGQIVVTAYPAKNGLPILGYRLDPVGTANFPPTSQAIEFYHAGFDHYFIAVDPKEIADLDTGVHKGWARTGKAFAVYAASATGMRAVCRFYIPPNRGDSHFFSASSAECADVLQKTQTDPAYAGYVYESPAAFYIGLPDVTTGICPIGTIGVYRLWNGRTDSNHRYTTDKAVRDEMVAKGYVSEGYGSEKFAMCAPV